MHEFNTNDSYDNEGIPPDRFTFEQISALFHMKYLYHQNPDMPRLAGRALESARDDVQNLEEEIGQIEEAEAQREEVSMQQQLEAFFADYNAGFRARQEWRDRLCEDERPYEAEEVTNIGALGDEFTVEQQMLLFGMRHEYEDNAQADEAKVVAEGRVTQGEMLLAREAERAQKLERLRQLFNNGYGYVLGPLFDGEMPVGKN